MSCKELPSRVGFNGLRKGNLSLQLLLAAEVHQDLIFNTSCRIGRQTRSFCRVKAGNALDESDGPDGDQIVLVGILGVVFLYDVRDQTQIVFDQCVPGFRVALSQTIQTFPLLRGGQWPRKRAAPFQTQRKKSVLASSISAVEIIRITSWFTFM